MTTAKNSSQSLSVATIEKETQSSASDSPISSNSAGSPSPQKLGLLHRAMEEYLLPEAKVLLLALILHDKREASLQELQNLSNSPLHEASFGVDSLRTAKINVDKSINRIELSPEWVL
jgi:hypothetical protein